MDKYGFVYGGDPGTDGIYSLKPNGMTNKLVASTFMIRKVGYDPSRLFMYSEETIARIVEKVEAY